MIFFFPIVLGAAAVAATATGVAAGVDGVSKMKRAKRIGKEAERRHKRRCKKLKEKFKATQGTAARYGKLQLKVQQDTIRRFVKFIEQIGRNASQEDLRYLHSLEGVSTERVQKYRAAVLEAEKIAQSGVTAALVGLFSTASTGAAIGGLSGVVTGGATLTCLGGGSLAAGGGGIALGSLVLGGMTVGPALMLGGFALAGQGKEALTKAREFRAKVNTKIAKLKASEDFLEQVQRRIRELKRLVKLIDEKATNGLSELESKPFDFQKDAVKFQQVAILIKALSEIIKTPILNSEGKINTNLGKLTEKYKNI
jgi:TolA-binding protein